MAVTNKRIKQEKIKRSSLVITEKDHSERKGGTRNGKGVSWSESSDDEDHLYQLIRGVPTVMVSNGNSQSKTDFIPKRDFIGRKEKGVQRNAAKSREEKS